MLALAFSFVILTISLSVFSIPVPTAPITTVTTPTKTLSRTTGSATSTARLDVTSPLKFGELNAPSEGGVFNDFVAGQVAEAAPSSSKHVPRVDVESSHSEALKYKRSILAHLFEKQGKFPVFAEKKKGKGAKPPKAAAGAKAKAAGGKGGKAAGKPAKAGGAGAADAADEED